MSTCKRYICMIFICLVGVFVTFLPVTAQTFDIRGVWVGKAKGPIFGAEGSVTITRQDGEDILGIVEGGNIFGKARFTINGKIRGNRIIGQKQGNIFQGVLYSDWSIRGALKTTDGETYRIVLRRSHPYWGGMPRGQW